EVDLRRTRPWILLQCKALGPNGPTVHDHPHLVRTRRRHWSLRSGRPHDEPLERGRIGIAHVPVEVVDARLVGHTLRRWCADRTIFVVTAGWRRGTHRIARPARDAGLRAVW